MNKIVSKDQLVKSIGTKIEPTDWIEVTQERINLFAECTGDDYFIQIDSEKAKKTDLGGTIAHGSLTLALLPNMIENFIVPKNLVYFSCTNACKISKDFLNSWTGTGLNTLNCSPDSTFLSLLDKITEKSPQIFIQLLPNKFAYANLQEILIKIH